jgi:hypothetical protein
MVLAYDVAHNARRLFVRPVIGVGKLILRIQNAPVHGLETIARVRYGAPDDH